MNKLLHTLWRGFALGIMIILCGLALPAFGSVVNGDVIQITASCQYTLGLGNPTWYAGSTLDTALACRLIDEPVYLTQGWQQNQGLAAGMLVRAFVRKDGEVGLANGVQLSDGRVMVDGQILDRADP